MAMLQPKLGGHVVLRVAVIAQTTGPADMAEQQHLAITADDRVLRLRRVRSDDNRPTLYECVVMPIGRLPGFAPEELVVEDLVVLARAHGIALGTARGHFNEVYPPERWQSSLA